MTRISQSGVQVRTAGCGAVGHAAHLKTLSINLYSHFVVVVLFSWGCIENLSFLSICFHLNKTELQEKIQM